MYKDVKSLVIWLRESAIAILANAFFEFKVITLETANAYILFSINSAYISFARDGWFPHNKIKGGFFNDVLATISGVFITYPTCSRGHLISLIYV